MGTNAWSTFLLRVEHPYIVGNPEKSLDMGEPPIPCHKNCILPFAAANQSAFFSFSDANHYQKLHKKHSIRVIAHGIR